MNEWGLKDQIYRQDDRTIYKFLGEEEVEGYCDEDGYFKEYSTGNYYKLGIILVIPHYFTIQKPFIIKIPIEKIYQSK